MILNRQRSVTLSTASLERFWQRVRDEMRLPEDSLTFCLVSDAQIARWNLRYRGKREATDVLSFPAGDGRREPHRFDKRGRNGATGAGKAKRRSRAAAAVEERSDSGEESYLGDIAIAPGVARRNARRLGRGLDLELRILMLHGVLHLLGYDHETDDGEMNRLERRLRRRLGLNES